MCVGLCFLAVSEVSNGPCWNPWQWLLHFLGVPGIKGITWCPAHGVPPRFLYPISAPVWREGPQKKSWHPGQWLPALLCSHFLASLMYEIGFFRDRPFRSSLFYFYFISCPLNGLQYCVFLFAHHFPGISGVKAQGCHRYGKHWSLVFQKFRAHTGEHVLWFRPAPHTSLPAFQLPEHDMNAYLLGSGLFCSTSGDFCSAQPLADFYPYAMLESIGGNPAEPVADWISIAPFQRWGEAGKNVVID